jgi:uncharacterized sulfatase
MNIAFFARPDAFLVAMLAALLVGAAPARARADDPPRRPDVVVFIADDLSAGDCSPYGGTDIPSPNMAALAREGLTFDRAYATSPSCAPSRAALLTGCYNARTGAMFNHQKPRDDVGKWPACFQALGYEVVAFGKVAHYAQVTAYGFDHAAFYRYHEDVCVDKAVEWLAARKSDKPLCLMVGTNFPHVPWPQREGVRPADLKLPARVADTPETRTARAHYAAAVTRADSDLGEVRGAARRHLPPDTLFVFTADQGAQWPFAKWNLYEAGVRVPLVVVWPGHVAAGRRTAAMVSWIDLLPTLHEAAGADPRSAAPGIDGRSFLPVLTGKADAHRDRVFATHSGDGNVNYYPSRSARLGSWKYIRNLDASLEFHTHIDRLPQDTGYWPSWVERARSDPQVEGLIRHYTRRPAEELYDLSADPDESKNLAGDAAHASELERCRAALDEWMTANHDKGIATDRGLRPAPAPAQPATK